MLMIKPGSFINKENSGWIYHYKNIKYNTNYCAPMVNKNKYFK